jgi:hypothetical protein
LCFLFEGQNMKTRWSNLVMHVLIIWRCMYWSYKDMWILPLWFLLGWDFFMIKKVLDNMYLQIHVVFTKSMFLRFYML